MRSAEETLPADDATSRFGLLTGGLAIAGTSGFVLGVVVGFAGARLSTPPPPPRWRVWR